MTIAYLAVEARVDLAAREHGVERHACHRRPTHLHSVTWPTGTCKVLKKSSWWLVRDVYMWLQDRAIRVDLL